MAFRYALPVSPRRPRVVYVLPQPRSHCMPENREQILPCSLSLHEAGMLQGELIVCANFPTCSYEAVLKEFLVLVLSSIRAPSTDQVPPTPHPTHPRPHLLFFSHSCHLQCHEASILRSSSLDRNRNASSLPILPCHIVPKSGKLQFSIMLLSKREPQRGHSVQYRGRRHLLLCDRLRLSFQQIVPWAFRAVGDEPMAAWAW